MKKGNIMLLVMGMLIVLVVSACSADETSSDAEVAADDAAPTEESEASEPVETGVEKLIQVGPILVDCEGEGPQPCMLIREREMDKWQLWYQGIEGFEYEEGFLYTLQIEEQSVENPPAGGSSVKWVLKEELSKAPVTTSEMIVGPEQVECTGAGPQLCYLVKWELDGEWEYFYSNIEGFVYEPGFEYELLVAQIPVENAPADASTIQYLLVEEVSKTPVETADQEQDNVTGTIWAATSINGKPLIEGSIIVLGVSPGRIGGMSGCNTYFGPVEVDRNEVAVGPLGSTRKACADDIIEQEGYYLTALESAATVEIDGDEMNVYDSNGEIVLTFETVEPQTLEGTTWVLSTYNNGENAMVSALAETFVSANFEDDQVSGSAGCNNYFGAYEATEDTISIGPLASTMMLCLDPVNEQEQQFLAALESAATYQIIANRLELINADGALAAMFQAAEPLDLAGTAWNVTSYNNGRGGVTSVIIGTEINASFDEETVGGLSGCNNYTGGYEVDGDSIRFGPLATTRKMCADPEGIMEQEAEFLAALQASTTFEIQGTRMDMYFEDGARAVVLELIP